MAVTQDELYATLDLDLSWSEAELPERERTKHVHRLHPYHGKFIPQLVEVLLDRYLAPGDHVLDPFAGSGTTLVQALESGWTRRAWTSRPSTACSCASRRRRTTSPIWARSCRTSPRVSSRCRAARGRPGGYLREWYAPQAAAELLAFRDADPGVPARATFCA